MPKGTRHIPKRALALVLVCLFAFAIAPFAAGHTALGAQVQGDLQTAAPSDEEIAAQAGDNVPAGYDFIVNEKGEKFLSLENAFAAVPTGGSTTLTLNHLSIVSGITINRNIDVTMRTTESATAVTGQGITLSNGATLRLEGSASHKFVTASASKATGNSKLIFQHAMVVGTVSIDASTLTMSNVEMRDYRRETDGLKGSISLTNGSSGSIADTNIQGNVFVGERSTLYSLKNSTIMFGGLGTNYAALKLVGYGSVYEISGCAIAGIRGIEMASGGISTLKDSRVYGSTSEDGGRGILLNPTSRIDAITGCNIWARTAIECTNGAAGSANTGIEAIENTNLRSTGEDLVKWKDGALGEVKLEPGLMSSNRAIGSGNYYCTATYLDERWDKLAPDGYKWVDNTRTVSSPSEMKGSDYRYLVATGCKITYDPNGASGTVKYSSEREGGTEITLDSAQACGFSAQGHVFKGWNTKPDGTGASFTAGSHYKFTDVRFLTLYAQWDGANHTVTFDSQGGSAVEAKLVPSGLAVTRPSDPTRDHATFAGWYTDKACTQAYDFSQPVTGNLTLYGKWTTVKVTVTFVTNGGTAVASQQVDYNTVPVKPEDPTRPHYRFSRWCWDEACTYGCSFSSSDTVRADTTLYADWRGYDYCHVWDEGVVTTQPTCTMEGVKTYTCSADTHAGPHTKTEVIPALGHDVAVVQRDVVQPTCTATGSCKQVEVCNRDGCDWESEPTSVTIPKRSHTTVYEEELVQAPTCTASGTKREGKKCTTCGNWVMYMSYSVPNLGHSWGAWHQTVAPGETTPGEEQRECQRDGCSATETRTVDPVPHTHSLTHVPVKLATCEVDGTREHWVCTGCGKTFSDANGTIPLDDVVIEATGHDVDEPTIVNVYAPTCTAKGSHDEAWHCTHCGELLYTEVGVVDEMVAHTPADPVTENVHVPTCTAKGSHDEVVRCSVCNTEISRETHADEMVAHTPADPVSEVIDAPTCTAKGSHYEVVRCSVCNAELSRDVREDEMIAHTPGAAVRENEVAGTCIVEGHHDEVVYCTVCNTELERDTVSDGYGAHVPSGVVQLNQQAATCTQPATHDEMTYCTTCLETLSWATKTDSAALGHSAGAAVTENAVAPTCEQDGHHDAVEYCTRCNAELSRTSVTDSRLFHQWGGWQQVVPAGETQEGLERRTCQRAGCGSTEERPIPPTGHIHGPFTHYPAVASQCDDLGNKEFWVCNTCGRWFSDNAGQNEIADISEIAAEMPPHVAGDPQIENVKQATCTEDGSHDEVVHCKNCNHVMSSVTVVDEAHGHDPSDFDIQNVVEPTATKPGSYDFVVSCATCGEELSRDTLEDPATGVTYQSVQGDGSSWTRGSTESLTFTFKRSEADEETFERFTGILIGGKEVPREAYEVHAGSAIVVLPPEYLETLDTGDHMLVAQFNDDAVARAIFTVLERPSDTSATPAGDAPGDQADKNAQTSQGGSNAPKTGDATVTLAQLALLAALAAIGTAFYACTRIRPEDQAQCSRTSDSE